MGNRSTRWFHRHVHDSWVQQAKKQGKRSRAAFKLTQILQAHHCVPEEGAVVIDLGCAPGSWSEEMVAMCPKGKVVGIDILPVAPIRGATIVQGDFLSPEGIKALNAALGNKAADMILSDMAPEMSGNRVVDQCAAIALNEAAVEFCQERLTRGGTLLMKSFMGEGFDDLRGRLLTRFQRVKNVKPVASRKNSRELFLLATDYVGGKQTPHS